MKNIISIAKKLLIICTICMCTTSHAQNFFYSKTCVCPGASVSDTTKIITRVNIYRTMCVHNYYDEYNNPTFLVQNVLASSGYQFSLPQTYGQTWKRYWVNDVQLEHNECWFCGSVEQATGNIIYNLDGTITIETEQHAILGHFALTDVLNGSCIYKLMDLYAINSLEKLSVWDGGGLAIGLDEDGTQQIVQIKEFEQSGSIRYKYRAHKSNNSYEYFVDLLNARGTAVTLSTIQESNQSAYSSFLLRYGTPSDFCGTNTKYYSYPVHFVFHMLNLHTATYSNPADLHLAYKDVTNGNDIVVGYVSHNGFFDGRMLLYKIAQENDPSPQVLYNSDSYRYNSMKDIKFNHPLYNISEMAVLLSDNQNLSNLRFPFWDRTSPYTDSILYHYNFMLKSIAPFQYSDELDLLAVGYHNLTNKLAVVTEKDVHYEHHMDHSCLPYRTGTMSPHNSILSPSAVNSGWTLTHNWTVMRQTTDTLTSYLTNYTVRCSN